MRPLDNAFELYRLGGAISAVRKKISERQSRPLRYTDLFIELSDVQTRLDMVVSNALIPLDTCKENAMTLKATVDTIVRTFFASYRAADNEEAKTAVWQQVPADGWQLNEQINAFEYVFSAELARTAIYLVDQVGAYRTSAIIEAADTVFPKNIREQLPEEAVADIRAAGKCLAFDLHTAAGFHIARAVETVLLKYFSALGIPIPKIRNLGKYIEALSEAAKKGNSIDTKVVAAVDQFRDLYRNPIMHPEAVLSADEAAILFALAQSTISAIILDIAKLAANSAALVVVAPKSPAMVPQTQSTS